MEGTIEPGPRVTVITREEGQEYISLGSRAVSYLERDRYPLLVLATLMGGGMSSRLFQKVREEKGLAYSVFAYLECFAETGLWAAGLSLKPEWTHEALELIFEEFRLVVRDGLRAGELEELQGAVAREHAALPGEHLEPHVAAGPRRVHPRAPAQGGGDGGRHRGGEGRGCHPRRRQGVRSRHPLAGDGGAPRRARSPRGVHLPVSGPGPVVRVRRLAGAEDLPLPSYETPGAAGLDLRAAIPEPVSLAPGDIRALPTGFSLAIPEGYEGQIRPRSGLALNQGLSVPNAPGTIDSDYRGEVRVILVNLGREPVTITRGQRIAQTGGESRGAGDPP